MKISITNHTGSRNKGCEALVRSKIDGFRRANSAAQLEFVLHSNDPLYDSWRFGREQVAYSYALRTPNHLSSRSVNRALYASARLAEKILPNSSRLPFSLKHFSHLRSSDLVVASGGDIFTSDYANMRKHMAPVMSARAPVYLCSHTIGPFAPKDEAYFLENSDTIKLITVREAASYDYLKKLGIDAQLELTADVAFALPPAANGEALWRLHFDEADEVVALSVSEGIIRYSGLDAALYYKTWAQFIAELVKRQKKVLLIPHVVETNPNNNDLVAAGNVLQHCDAGIMSSIRVASCDPSAAELKALIGRCSALIGTRTHATIGAMSQCVPTVSVAYSRKAHGIMQEVFGAAGAALTIDAKALSLEALVNAYEAALENPPQKSVITGIKAQANRNFDLLAQFL